jgi:hypothetical protein
VYNRSALVFPWLSIREENQLSSGSKLSEPLERPESRAFFSELQDLFFFFRINQYNFRRV